MVFQHKTDRKTLTHKLENDSQITLANNKFFLWQAHLTSSAEVVVVADRKASDITSLTLVFRVFFSVAAVSLRKEILSAIESNAVCEKKFGTKTKFDQLGIDPSFPRQKAVYHLIFLLKHAEKTLFVYDYPILFIPRVENPGDRKQTDSFSNLLIFP